MRPILLLLLPLAFLPAFAQTPAQAAPTPEQIARMQATLADWPNLTRYQAENAKLPPPAAGEQRVVFMGDSITDNWGRFQGDFFTGKPYVNRGISGQTTPQMLLRFQQDVLNLHPAAVVLLAGINDIAGNTGPETLAQMEDNIRAMVTLARAAHVRVILASVLPAGRIPWRPGVEPAQPVRDLNAWLEDYARQTHSTWLNYYPALALPDGSMRPELATDKAVHPNTAGYALMQPLAEEAIRKSLAGKRP